MEILRNLPIQDVYCFSPPPELAWTSCSGFLLPDVPAPRPHPKLNRFILLFREGPYEHNSRVFFKN